MSKKVLILGYGDIANRLSKLLSKKDFDLYIDNFQNINEIDRAGWVCGLGHGILKETPEENVHYFIENIRKIFS